MRSFRFLLTAAVLVAALTAFVGTAAAQEPPVGNPPEPDDAIMQQIAQLLLGSSNVASGGVPIEEDPQLWDLIKQQQPDLTVTLGVGGSVGGIAELPDVEGAPAQTANSSSGPSPALIAALLIGLLALGAVAWYTRRRLHLLLILGFAVSAFFIAPAQQSEAGLASCILTARDVDIAGPFNYLWYAAAACLGEDWEKAHISVDLQYYDWNQERWQFLQVAGTAGEGPDQDIFIWGATAVGPYLGINCRRIDAKFFFTHSGRQQDFTLRSNGECY